MKFFLSIILAISLFKGCGDSIDDKDKRNDHWIWWNDTKTGKSYWVKLADETTIDKGNYTAFYFNGVIREKGKLDKGKRIDTSYHYDLNGQFFAYTVFTVDTFQTYFIKNGPYKVYYADGKISTQGIIQNHIWGDKLKSYYENGNIKEIRDFVRDTGWLVKYYENGQIKDSVYHIKGLRNFRIKYWYENGKLSEYSGFKNGSWNGVHKSYYENGQISDSGYSINGNWVGIYKEWYENGKLKEVKNNKNNLLNGLYISYYENGQIKETGYVVDGKFTSVPKQYNENGKLISDSDATNKLN